MIVAALILIGAILAIASAFTPWYSEKFTYMGATITQNAYPGLPNSNGTIQYSCSGLPSEVSCPSSSSYSSDHANHTGTIAETGFFLVIVAFVLGLIGAILILMSRNNPKRGVPALALGVVAMILAIAAVGVFAGALPGAIGADSPGHSGTGPWSSFIGSGNASGYGASGGSLSWGPSIGWYLAIGAFILFLVGIILLWRSRKDSMASAAPATASTPAPATGSTTPPVPPSQ
jgi:hypothetical protein